MTNSEFYLGAYKKYGLSPKGLNWNSLATQEIRFEIITKFLEDKIDDFIIGDAGCGFGDFLKYWQIKHLEPKEYVGIDCEETFVEICQRRFPSNCFVCRDILQDRLPQVDWYVASGSLNILSDFETWLFLENMLNSATKGVVFNILCGTKRGNIFNYKTKDDMMNFAKKKSLKIEIVDDYLKNDMTIRLQKRI